MTASKSSVAERFAAFPRGAQELSAARLARDVLSVLDKAMRVRGRKQKDLAAELGLSGGAVSQVLNGDGNLRVATLARYLRALGYEARLELQPVDPNAPELKAGPVPRPRARATAAMSPCGVSGIPGSRSDSWTVLDSCGDVFGVRVNIQDAAYAGRQRFSGELKTMPTIQFRDRATPSLLASGPHADVLRDHGHLLAQVGD